MNTHKNESTTTKVKSQGKEKDETASAGDPPIPVKIRFEAIKDCIIKDITGEDVNIYIGEIFLQGTSPSLFYRDDMEAGIEVLRANPNFKELKEE